MTNPLTNETHTHTTHCWWNPDQARWVCASPGLPVDRPASSDRPLVDVRDMLVVHTALLREFRLAPAAVRRTTRGDRKQARAVDGHVGLLCDMLHHHHAGEDELLWPKLRDRTPPAALADIEHVEAQHHGLDAALADVHDLRAAWVDDPTAEAGDELAAGLARLHTLLADHLDLEESRLLPMAASVLTPAEWKEIGDHGAASTPKSMLMLAFGMFAYEGDPAVLRDMLASAPPPVRALVPRIAPRAYAKRARRVYGTARP